MQPNSLHTGTGFTAGTMRFPQPPLGPHSLPRIIGTKTRGTHLFNPEAYSRWLNPLHPDAGLELGGPIPGHALLVQFSGPVGAGKGTMSKRLMVAIPGSKFLVTCTTRDRRDDEEHGKHYWFLTEPEFDGHLDAGEFIETNKHPMTQKRYGTLLPRICDQMESGGVIFSDIDVNGASQMRKEMHKLPGVVLDIFLMPPGETVEAKVEECRRRAMLDENAKRDNLEGRLGLARAEMGRANEFTHVVFNGDLDHAFREILGIVSEVRLGQLRLRNACAV